MNPYRRGLFLRLILGILGFALALESIFLSPSISIPRPNVDTGSSSYPQDTSGPGWVNDSSDSGGGGWDVGGSSDSSWDSGSGGWDSGGGGDSGSWDSGGGDSGSW